MDAIKDVIREALDGCTRGRHAVALRRNPWDPAAFRIRVSSSAQLTAAGEGNTAAMRQAAAGRCSIGVASKERVSSSRRGATLPPPPTARPLAPPPSAPALRHPQSGYAACGETACLGGERPCLILSGVSCLGVECMPSEAAPQKHPAKDGGPMAGVGAGEGPSLIWLGTTGSFWLAAGSAAHAAVQILARVRASTLRRRLTRLATFQIREDH